MNLTPESIAKAGTESAHQKALFCWMALPEMQLKYPMLKWAFHIPNGGSRGDDPLRARKIGGELKAEGVKAGVPDIFLPYPVGIFDYACQRYDWTHGLWIEMKVRPNKPSDPQFLFMNQMHEWGYRVELCYSWTEARDAIMSYLA